MSAGADGRGADGRGADGGDGFDALIAALEAMTGTVSAAAAAHDTDAVDRAIAATSHILSDALPADARDPWLSELAAMAAPSPSSQSSAPSAKSPSPSSQPEKPEDVSRNASERTSPHCDGNCPFVPAPQPSASQPPASQQHAVPCLHRCGVMFCSPRCRKASMKRHRPDCAALVRRAVLKRIGLSAEPELF